MLVLTREINQEILIGNDIKITVVGIKGGKVKIGIDAPEEIEVDRKEVREKKKLSGKPIIISVSANG
jgi:carbon storage regulator